jgi:hypothetical protein
MARLMSTEISTRFLVFSEESKTIFNKITDSTLTMLELNFFLDSGCTPVKGSRKTIQGCQHDAHLWRPLSEWEWRIKK